LRGRLNLSRAAYSGICLGKDWTWDAVEIAQTNPHAQLPNLPLVLVHRADRSGTTFVFTKHLSFISPEWRQGPGTSPAPAWPVGVAADGNDGVADFIKRTPGAIGYLDYGHARTAGLPMAVLENNAGSLVAPTIASGQEALTGFKLPADLRGWVPDPPGKAAYPIVTFTWVLCYLPSRAPPQLTTAVKSDRVGDGLASMNMARTTLPSRLLTGRLAARISSARQTPPCARIRCWPA